MPYGNVYSISVAGGRNMKAFAASATSISLLILFKFILQTFDTTLLILTFCVMKVVATGNRHTNILFKYLK
jgi:hypothetical protein